MIFAAGLGTRLRPYTDDKPKALVEVNGKPLLELAIRYLIKFGFNDLVINVHHFADQVIDFLNEKHKLCADIQISDERDLLLDTGGGLKRALPLLGSEPFLLFNTDVLTNLDLEDFYRFHLKHNNLATLAVRRRKSSRYLMFDNYMRLSGWRNYRTGDQEISRKTKKYQDLAFSGIHVVDPSIADFMPDKKVFSIIDVYLKAAENYTILGYDHSDTHWMDVGRVADLERAKQD